MKNPKIYAQCILLCHFLLMVKTVSAAELPLRVTHSSDENYGIGTIATQKKITAENLKLQSALAELQRESQQSQKTLSTLEEELKTSTAALDTFRAKDTLDSQPPQTNEEKQAYVAGQFFAAGIRGRLQGWEATGVTLDEVALAKGVRDGVQGNTKLSQEDMDVMWQTLSDTIQKGIAERVQDGENQIEKLLKGKKPDLIIDGVTYHVLKPGKKRTDPSEAIQLSLREQVSGGKIVSNVPLLTLSAGEEMPAVVRNGLPLLGQGGDVVAYALAKSVYGNLPLPQGVMPFTVLEYRLTWAKGTAKK